jgi:hypothetical protein
VILERATYKQSLLLFNAIVYAVKSEEGNILKSVPTGYGGIVNPNNIQPPTQPSNPVNTASPKKISEQTIVAYGVLIIFVYGELIF